MYLCRPEASYKARARGRDLQCHLCGLQYTLGLGIQKPMQVMFTVFRTQGRYNLYTWIPRDILYIYIYIHLASAAHCAGGIGGTMSGMRQAALALQSKIRVFVKIFITATTTAAATTTTTTTTTI